MDSMRTLNTSLPGTSPPKPQATESPEQLLQAFKTAALSVTNLYKSAAKDHTKARSEGYQDCLDDLLSFLDKEDLGLGDGEGWKIRRWATERLDGREPVTRAQESDDEAEQTDRASSPVLQRADSSGHMPTRNVSPSSTEVAVPPIPAAREASPVINTFEPPVSSTFHFPTPYTYPPQDSEMNISDLNLSDRQTHDPVTTTSSHTRSSNNSTRASRHRHSGHSGRPVTRNMSSLRSAVGHKRKAVNLEDYWNIDDLGPYGKDKDGSGGGGKRTRFT